MRSLLVPTLMLVSLVLTALGARETMTDTLASGDVSALALEPERDGHVRITGRVADAGRAVRAVDVERAGATVRVEVRTLPVFFFLARPDGRIDVRVPTRGAERIELGDDRAVVWRRTAAR